MDAPAGVVYTGLLMAVTVGMSVWRFATAGTTIGTEADRMLGACLLTSVGLFVAVLLPYYLPGIDLP